MKVLVIGNGMVGSRFVDELVRRDPDVRVTVLGKETHEPYNRVLLSSVVAGKTAPDSLAMATADSDRVDVLAGVAATHIDRAARTVTDSRGQRHSYDRLVFATGSQARIPSIQGIATDRGLIPGVSVLKDLDDAEGIVAAIPKARRAVVLGAGVLGLEVATGLASRGLAVTLVHHSDRLMERQLGDAASRIATGSLTRLGVTVITQTSVAHARDRRGVLSAVTLTDGTELLTDMLVMCAGTIPEAALARGAGLPCERGILVGADLASPADSSVFAIGDCAQPPEGGTGLVAQGWDQASRLVDQWTADAVADRAAQPSEQVGADLTNVVRVKAMGLDVVTMGLSGKFDHGERDLRAVRMSDPAIGRFVEVVVSHGLLVGATVVGDKQCASELSAMYTRMLPVPSDPAHLIIRPLASAARPAATSVADMGDDHTVCQCNSVPKGRIVAAVEGGCGSVEDVSRATRAGTGCGDCRSLVGDIIRSCAAAQEANDAKVPALAGSMEG
ncbi:FAD-dependent oxidoreductase [Demequina activiva]|uniref:FAD/NAD(P)-binding oxidoreductase n=1 Tax=Demequina activiva TaxID=1582364 RepID=A0A919UKK1_9MICO|nr:FAD-dependent oxidoreductase [Demequina activiva]GIG55060.1 FAD/NAD(P)-binding oxidoreductase [Demequina activiva]